MRTTTPDPSSRPRTTRDIGRAAGRGRSAAGGAETSERAMIDYFKTVLTGQFEASLCMLDKCIRECPPEHWESKIANGAFRQVAYHTLFYADLYLSPGLEAFEPAEVNRRGGVLPAGVATCGGLTRDDTLAYLAACRHKAVQTF